METLEFGGLRSGGALVVSLCGGLAKADHPALILTLSRTLCGGDECLDAGRGVQSILCTPGVQLKLVPANPNLNAVG